MNEPRFRRVDVTVDSHYGEHTYRLYADCTDNPPALYAPTDWRDCTFSGWSIDDRGLLFQGQIVNGSSFVWVDKEPSQGAEDELNKRVAELGDDES